MEYAWKQVESFETMHPMKVKNTIVHIRQELTELLRIADSKDLRDDILLCLYATTVIAERFRNA